MSKTVSKRWDVMCRELISSIRFKHGCIFTCFELNITTEGGYVWSYSPRPYCFWFSSEHTRYDSVHLALVDIFHSFHPPRRRDHTHKYIGIIIKKKPGDTSPFNKVDLYLKSSSTCNTRGCSPPPTPTPHPGGGGGYLGQMNTIGTCPWKGCLFQPFFFLVCQWVLILAFLVCQ